MERKVIFHVDECGRFEMAAGCRELLREEGVEIAVCNNALRKNGIAAEELTEGVRVVPAGVVELAERQFQGYAYIRP